MDNVVRRARNDELPGSEFVVTATFQPKIVELNTNFVFLKTILTNLVHLKIQLIFILTLKLGYAGITGIPKTVQVLLFRKRWNWRPSFKNIACILHNMQLPLWLLWKWYRDQHSSMLGSKIDSELKDE